MPFAPTDIAGLKLWLKADAITGLVDGDPVGAWNDSSGVANNTSQATASKKPTYRTNILNGKPVVRFDGVDDVLQRAAPTGFPTGAGAFTVFVVVRPTDNTTGRTALNYGTAATSQAFHLLYRGGGAMHFDRYGFSGECSFGVVAMGAAYRLAARYDGTSRRTYRDGLLVSTTAATFALVNGTVDIGALASASLYWAGDIAEVILYAAALSDADRGSVESYLDAKYFTAPAVGADPSFHEVVYPLSLERCTSTHEWLTNIIELGDQSEQRIPIGSDGRRKFDAAHGVRSLTDLRALLKFHALRHGEAYGFKVRDLVDYSVSKGPEGTLQHVYDGTTKSFQLQKVYSDAAAVWIREIYKPEQGSVKVYKNSVLLTEGFDYTIAYTTGIITFTAAPVLGDVIEWEGRFYVPVRFAVKEIPAAEFVAQMYEDTSANQWLVRGGTVDLPEVPMIEVRNI